MRHIKVHFHHLLQNKKYDLIQAPALDGGSWIENYALTSANCSTFTIDEDGVDNIKVLKGTVK